MDIELLNQTFAGGRSAPSGKHHKWDKLFIRVKAAKRCLSELREPEAK